MHAGSNNERPGWKRLAGGGIELAGGIVGFTIVGYLFGRYFGSPLWGVLIGSILGVIGGLYNLVRAALNVTRESGSKPPPPRE